MENLDTQTFPNSDEISTIKGKQKDCSTMTHIEAGSCTYTKPPDRAPLVDCDDGDTEATIEVYNPLSMPKPTRD